MTIPLISGRGKGKTVNNCPINRAIPGWKEKVEPVRNDSIFWHDIWINAGRPNKGMIFEIMKRIRNKYHYALRSVKKVAAVINSKLLLDAAQKGNIHLMNELKKFRQSGKNAGSRPEVIENADNPDDIVMKFN